MNDLNEVLIEGRLVRDPNAKKIGASDLVCTFTLASNLHYVDKESGQSIEKTTYVLIETWKQVAESCATYLKKGDGVRVVGMLRQSRWKKEPKITMEKNYILAEHVEFKRKANQQITDSIKATEGVPNEQQQKQIEKEMINAEAPEEESFEETNAEETSED